MPSTHSGMYSTRSKKHNPSNNLISKRKPNKIRSNKQDYSKKDQKVNVIIK